MQGFKVSTDHLLIITQSGSQSLKEYQYVIGVSFEILSTSTDTNANFGLNERNKIPMALGDPAREYGGFNVCGIPCWYDVTVYWDFATGVAPRGLVIITTLQADAKEIGSAS